MFRKLLWEIRFTFKGYQQHRDFKRYERILGSFSEAREVVDPAVKIPIIKFLEVADFLDCSTIGVVQRVEVLADLIANSLEDLE